MSVIDRSLRLWKPLLAKHDTRAGEPVANPGRLLATPGDIIEADASQARTIYEGTFTFEGITHALPPGTLFESAPMESSVDRQWTAALHGFEWLRDVRASTAPTARINGAALIMDWVDTFGMPSSTGAGRDIAWGTDVAAIRLMAWLRHGESLLDPSNTGPQRHEGQGRPADTRPQRWSRNLVRHVRFLNNAAGEVPVGEVRLRVRIALTMAALCLDGRDRNVERAARALDQELAQQVAADGGHMSRSPAAQVRILCDLLPLLRLYGDNGKPAPDMLIARTARMVEALRFFRHANGRLAQFNGTGVVDDDLVGRLLRFDGVEGRPVASLSQTGFDRLASGRTVVLVDTGSANATKTPSKVMPDTMAGALSFEMSSGGHRFIMNCGWPGMAHAAYRNVARATAAHSTLTVADTSSLRFAGPTAKLKSAFTLGSARNSAPSPLSVPRRRADDDTRKVLLARHDGYATAFGLHHERHMELLEGGNTLQGADRLLPIEQTPSTTTKTTTATLRFHIPPDISVSHLASGHSVLLATTAGRGATEAWTFTCIDAPVRLEESIRFHGNKAGDPPRKAMQIALYVDVPADRETEIRWSLQRNVQSGRQQSGSGKEDGQVGDLLTVLEDVPPQDATDAGFDTG